MCDPGLQHLRRDIVLFEGFDQDLSPSVELAAEDAVPRMRGLQRPPLVLDRSAQKPRCVLKLEPFDAIALRPGKQEANHRVGETTVDEIVDDSAKDGFSTKLLEEGHLEKKLMHCRSRIKLRRLERSAHRAEPEWPASQRPVTTHPA